MIEAYRYYVCSILYVCTVLQFAKVAGCLLDECLTAAVLAGQGAPPGTPAARVIAAMPGEPVAVGRWLFVW